MLSGVMLKVIVPLEGPWLAFGPAENQQGSQGVLLKAALPKFSLKCFLQWEEKQAKADRRH